MTFQISDLETVFNQELEELSEKEMQTIRGGFDLLNLINVKYVPVSVASEGNTSADKIQISALNETVTIW